MTPDAKQGPSLIGLHGASISLIGQDYSISGMREMRGECWNWNIWTLDHAHLIICWLTCVRVWVCQIAEAKQNKFNVAVTLGILEGFVDVYDWKLLPTAADVIYGVGIY